MGGQISILPKGRDFPAVISSSDPHPFPCTARGGGCRGWGKWLGGGGGWEWTSPKANVSLDVAPNSIFWPSMTSLSWRWAPPPDQNVSKGLSSAGGKKYPSQWALIYWSTLQACLSGTLPPPNCAVIGYDIDGAHSLSPRHLSTGNRRYTLRVVSALLKKKMRKIGVRSLRTE